MYCIKCSNDVADCTCGDIQERLASLAQHPNLSFRMCTKCNQHYSFCKCEEPNWVMSHQYEEERKKTIQELF